MIELAGVQQRDDDRVAEMLLAGVPEAHRLASWILRDSVGAEDAVQEALMRAWSRRRSIQFDSGEPHRWFILSCGRTASRMTAAAPGQYMSAREDRTPA